MEQSCQEEIKIGEALQASFESLAAPEIESDSEIEGGGRRRRPSLPNRPDLTRSRIRKLREAGPSWFLGGSIFLSS
jgi:hypothetical protein